MKEKILKKIAELSHTHYKKVIIVSIILTLLFGLLALRLQLATDIVNLLPSKAKVSKDFMNAIKDFGTLDFLVIVVQTKEDPSTQPSPQRGEGASELKLFADEFAKRLSATNLLKGIDYKISEKQKDFFREHFTKDMFLFLTEKELDAIREKLNDDEIEKQIKKNKSILISQVSFGMKELVRVDPLGLLPILKDYFSSGSGGFRFDMMDGYFLSEDRTTLLMLARPVKGALDVEFAKVLMSEAKRIEKEIVAEKNLNEKIKVGYTGGYPIAVGDEATIKRDMMLTFISSFFTILLLFYFAYRGFAILFYISIPLQMSLVWSFGISYIFLGQLNMVTVAFAAILMGLGIDFAIHIYNRYLEEIDKGADIVQGLEATLVGVGKGIFTGAATTATAFYLLMLTDFRGLSELGFMCGTGILSSMLTMYLVLPSIMIWRAKSSKRPVVKGRLNPFGLDKVAIQVVRYPKIVLFIGLGLTMFLGYKALFLEFDSDFKKMRPEGMEAMVLQDLIMEKFSGSGYQIMVITESNDLQAALERNDSIAIALRPFVEDGSIVSFDSLSTFLPSIKRQKASIAKVSAFPIERAIHTLQRSLKENGFKPDIYRDYINAMKSYAEAKGKAHFIEVEDIKAGMHQLLDKHLVLADGTYKIVTYLYPSKEAWNQGLLMKLENNLGKIDPQIKITGVDVVASELKRLIEEETVWVTLLAYSAVFVLVFLDFRSLKKTIIALVPHIIGIIWMMGVMEVLGMKLNYMNIAIVPLIVGMGIDNGVHIFHRYLEDGRQDIPNTIFHTGRAVVMTSVTTMAGFGSLVFSRYGGLSSMGAVANIGMITSLIAAIIVLPALLKIWKV
ncbi:MAG: MMPL family transporter [Nitrospirae bacterium]|nr:MMPL family transporter [Nitrospirota bacterium]